MSEDLLMFIGWAAHRYNIDFGGQCGSKDHVNIIGLCSCSRLWWCLSVHGPWCSRELYWHLWSVLPLEIILKFTACADSRDHMDAQGLCFGQKPTGSTWSMLHLIVKDKEGTFAVVLMTADSQLSNDMEGFCDNYNTPNPKYQRKTITA